MRERRLGARVPAKLLLYSDLHCPYAYLATYRLRKVLPAFEGRVEILHKCLAIEHVDSKSTPKDILDAETPHIVAEEPELRHAPWSAPESAWPVTMWPAFEAVKCAERQGWRLAHELDWRLRTAFFAESRCISMRHVLLDLAREVPGLDRDRFTEDFDSGVAKRLVLEESREGWHALDLEVSPTFVLPDGRRLANPAGPHVILSETGRPRQVLRIEPAPARGEAALRVYREMLESTARAG